MKTTRNISIDLDVWHRVIAEARKRRVSASWLTEEVLREFLITEKLANKKGRNWPFEHDHETPRKPEGDARDARNQTPLERSNDREWRDNPQSGRIR